MPTRKQKRRREKGRRHDYEYVYVDEEGREVEVDEPQQQKTAKNRNGRPVTGRGGRRIDPPSWTRVGKRALIFAPLMFVTIRFLGKGESPQTSVLETLFLMLVFLPFSYFMDSFLYRTYKRRAEQPKS